MPARIEPADPVVVVRDLYDDEKYVMTAFEGHAARCPNCADPLQTHAEGHNLCDRGRQHALDVAEYLYSEGGKHYSAVDRENGKPMRVRIPRDAVAVRGLLAAIEDGLRLRVPAVISYDRTYPVAPRLQPVQPPSQSPEPAREIIERSPKRRLIVYNSPRGSPSRGSLYNADRADRVERYETSRIYRPAEYYR